MLEALLFRGTKGMFLSSLRDVKPPYDNNILTGFITDQVALTGPSLARREARFASDAVEGQAAGQLVKTVDAAFVQKHGIAMRIQGEDMPVEISYTPGTQHYTNPWNPSEKIPVSPDHYRMKYGHVVYNEQGKLVESLPLSAASDEKLANYLTKPGYKVYEDIAAGKRSTIQATYGTDIGAGVDASFLKTLEKNPGETARGYKQEVETKIYVGDAPFQVRVSQDGRLDRAQSGDVAMLDAEGNVYWKSQGAFGEEIEELLPVSGNSDSQALYDYFKSLE